MDPNEKCHPIRDPLFNPTAKTRIWHRREKGLHACVDFACGDPSTNLIPTPIEAGSEAARGEVARRERSGQGAMRKEGWC